MFKTHGDKLMSKTRYYDRDGAPIDKDQWAEHRKDPSYIEMRVFDNGAVKVAVKWLGKIINPDNMDSEYWPLYALEVSNMADGRWAVDPSAGDTFGRIEEANKEYEEFLLQWTDSKIEENSKGVKVFVESDDNLYALPAAPDRNTPETVANIGDDGAGVW